MCNSQFSVGLVCTLSLQSHAFVLRIQINASQIPLEISREAVPMLKPRKSFPNRYPRQFLAYEQNLTTLESLRFDLSKNITIEHLRYNKWVHQANHLSFHCNLTIYSKRGSLCKVLELITKACRQRLTRLVVYLSCPQIPWLHQWISTTAPYSNLGFLHILATC